MSTAPRVLFFDLENVQLPHNIFHSGRKTGFGGHIAPGFLADLSYILCCGYKWLGTDDAGVIMASEQDFRADPLSDRSFLPKIIELVESADVVIGYNSKGHDFPYLSARALLNGFKFDTKVKHVDLLRLIKSKFNLSSFRLGHVAKLMGTAPKTEISHSLWPKCWMGNYDALTEIAEYCIDDVVALEELYFKMLPYIDLPLHMGKLGHGDARLCPSCGSDELIGHGIRVVAGGKRVQRFKCQSCGSTSSEKTNGDLTR